MMYIGICSILKRENQQFHNHSSCELAADLYLDLPLQGLHVVYDFIQHDCLANHLKQLTFPIFNLSTLNYSSDSKLGSSNHVCFYVTLLQPGTRSCSSFILWLIFSLLT
jgi:hypothetical protein